MDPLSEVVAAPVTWAELLVDKAVLDGAGIPYVVENEFYAQAGGVAAWAADVQLRIRVAKKNVERSIALLQPPGGR